jgi:hypothetical protein
VWKEQVRIADDFDELPPQVAAAPWRSALNLVLDTHILLWWLADDPKLSEAARVAIATRDPRISMYDVPVPQA